MQLILASTSIYRRNLLSRLGLPFDQADPQFEEAGARSMPPERLVRHNTLGKARSLLPHHPDASVIASDQIALCEDAVMGKPGDMASAYQQLQSASGRTIRFLTGVCLITKRTELFDIIPCDVHFRSLSDHEIRTYLEIERPFDCAGSFKSEGLGICLFEKIAGDDPTALIGLPLIRLSQWLQPVTPNCPFKMK